MDTVCSLSLQGKLHIYFLKRIKILYVLIQFKDGLRITFIYVEQDSKIGPTMNLNIRNRIFYTRTKFFIWLIIIQYALSHLHVQIVIEHKKTLTFVNHCFTFVFIKSFFYKKCNLSKQIWLSVLVAA